MSCDLSQERLNALIDGELTPADAATLLEQLRTDTALRERVGQLRLGKELVRHAYADLTPPRRLAPPSSGSHRWRAAAAGIVALACGALLGWTAREQGIGGPDAPVLLAEPGAQPLRGESARVLLHVSSGSARRGSAILDRAEGILQAARSSGRKVSVEIVANSDGLDLLREGVSAHVGRIAALRAAYPNLTLVACGQTAQRLREGGVAVRLLPGTATATSALDEIVLRMQQGWTYARI